MQTKEIWEMTLKELEENPPKRVNIFEGKEIAIFDAERGEYSWKGIKGGGSFSVADLHRMKVIEAHKEGKPVSAEILKEPPASQRGVEHIGIKYTSDWAEVGIASKGFDKKLRDGLIYGGLREGVISEGTLLIEDRRIADKFLGKLIKKQGLSDSEVERLKKEATFPDYHKYYPADNKDKGKLSIVAVKGDMAYLTDGKEIVAANANKLAFMHNMLPEAEMRSSGQASPITFVVKGEKKGLLMPMAVMWGDAITKDIIEKHLRETKQLASKPKEIKEKVSVEERQLLREGEKARQSRIKEYKHKEEAGREAKVVKLEQRRHSAEVRPLYDRRSEHARTIDEAMNAAHVVPMGSSLWLKHPNRYDIQGIDTRKRKPHKAKKQARGHNKSRQRTGYEALIHGALHGKIFDTTI